MHASLPLGLLLMSGFSLKPVRWLGLVVLVLVHELGHALLLRRFRLRVLGITLHGAGGECAYTNFATPVQDSIVAWGGVLAQLALFAAVTVLAETGVWPTDELGRDLYNVLAVLNVLLIVINLVPLGRLDGVRAWRLFWFAYLGLKRAFFARRLAGLAKKKRASHLRSLH